METKTEAKKRVGRPRKSDIVVVQTPTDVPKEPEKKKYVRKKKVGEDDNKTVSNISITKMMEDEETQNIDELTMIPVSEVKPVRKTIRKKKEELETDEIQESLSRLSIDENEESKRLTISSTICREDDFRIKRPMKIYPEYGTEEDYGNEMRNYFTKIYINQVSHPKEVDKIGLFYVLLSGRKHIHDDLIGVLNIETDSISSSGDRIDVEIDNKRKLCIQKLSILPSKDEIENDEWYTFCIQYRITKLNMSIEEMYESSKNPKQWFIQNDRGINQRLSYRNSIYDTPIYFKYGMKYYSFTTKYTLLHILETYFYGI